MLSRKVLRTIAQNCPIMGGILWRVSGGTVGPGCGMTAPFAPDALRQ
jgi:hypothetical protein